MPRRDYELDRDAARYLPARRREQSDIGKWAAAIVAAAAFVMICLVAMVIVKARSRGPVESTAEGQPAAPVFRGRTSFSAIQLQKAFDADRKGFAEAYEGRRIFVSGRVSFVSTDIPDTVTIVLDAATDFTHGQEQIYVYFRQTNTQRFSAKFLNYIDSLRRGSTFPVDVSGVFSVRGKPEHPEIAIDDAKSE